MSKQARAKRANKANSRTDRNSDKVVSIAKFQRKTAVKILPKNLNQEIFLENLNDDNIDICFGVGPAGSGKTYIATLMAIKMLKEGQIQKVVITRPNVAVDDRGIGHLPGNMLEKLKPYVQPILDIFEEYYSPSEILNMIEEGILELCPIAFIRGRTFKNAFVLIDEAQSTTQNSMLAILTRIGNNSKMVITGDIKQTDIKGINGLADFLERFETSNRISVDRFTNDDVERHPVVQEILKMYDEE